MRWYPFMRNEKELGLMGLLVLLDHCGPIPERIMHMESNSSVDYLSFTEVESKAMRSAFVDRGLLVYCHVDGLDEIMWCINPDIARDIERNTMDMLIGHSMLGDIFHEAVSRVIRHYTGVDSSDTVVDIICELVKVYNRYVDRDEKHESG
jgi:hypothetical protein